MSNLNSGLTKDQIIKEYDQLYDLVFTTLKNIDTKYLFQFVNMQKELLDLYRVLYSNNNDSNNIESIKNLQYRINEIEKDVLLIKSAMVNLISLNKV